MNWTGGRLHRHSNAGSSLKRKQEQHFAKVKQNLLLGKRRISPKQPNLDRIRQLHDVHDGSHPRSLEARGSYSKEDQNVDVRKTPHLKQNTHTNQHRPSKNLQRESNDRERQDPAALHSSVHPRAQDENIYATTPDRQPIKRERHISSSAASQSETDLVDESFSDKRRRILRKGDWVSIGFQRPPQLDFVASKNHEEIGRRRRVTDGHRARYNKSLRPHPPSPAVGIHRPPPVSQDQIEHATPRNPGQSDVKISIGGRIIPPGISSSSLPSKKASRSSGRQFSLRPPSKSSSDIMLLDYQGRGSQALGSHSHSNASQDDKNMQNIPNVQGPRFSSSSASLQHPMPQSSKVSSLLRSASSNITESLIAHVGKSRPVVSPSQWLENEAWQTWMESVLPANASLGRGDAISEYTQGEYHRNISPGVSAAPTNALVRDEATPSTSHSTDQDDFSRNETDQMNPSEVEDAYEDEDFGHGLVDDLSEGAGSDENLAQPNDPTADSSLLSSPLLAMKFKMPSPIGDSESTNSQAAPESTKSPSIDKTCHHSEDSTNRSLHVDATPPVRDIARTYEDVVGVVKDVPESFDIRVGDPFGPEVIEENPGDEIWKRIVFGSDSEQVDIFAKRNLGPDSLRATGTPRRGLRGSGNSSSFVESLAEMDENNCSQLYPRRHPSVSDFRSQIVRDGSYDTGAAELDLGLKISEQDKRSIRNSHIMNRSSAYFGSSRSPTQATEQTPSNNPQRGSSSIGQDSTVYPRSKKRVVFTRSTSSDNGISDSCIGERIQESFDSGRATAFSSSD